MTGKDIANSRDSGNEERKASSKTQFKIAVNKEVVNRKGTLKVTLETTAEFIAVVEPVKVIMIGAPVGQITTVGLFGPGLVLYQQSE